MITDDVRKLLGGYATNTLTEAERKALFEAAVDDQDLFNALQDEQALRDLLDDPSSRQLVRQALDVPREARPSRGRVWVWACSCAAIAAGVIAFIVFRPQPQQPRPLEVAQNTNASAPVPEEAAQTSSPPAPPLAVENKPIEKKAEAAASAQFGARESSERFAPAAGLAVPFAAGSAGSPVEPGRGGGGRFSQRDSLSAPRAIGALAGSPPPPAAPANPPGPQLSYSLIRRSGDGAEAPISSADLQQGDVIQIRVTSPVAGNLTLLQEQSAGDWLPLVVNRVVGAGSVTTLDPDIAVLATPQRFRVVLAGDSGPQRELQFQIVGR